MRDRVNSGRFGGRDPLFEPGVDFNENIVVARVLLHRLGRAEVVHQDDRRVGDRYNFGGAGIESQGGDVIDQAGAGLKRRRHYFAFAGVDRDGRAARREAFDDRAHAFDFVLRPDLLRSGPSRLSADVQNGGALAGHPHAGFHRRGRIFEPATVGEAVRSDVEDAHDLRLVEPDNSVTELQRRARAGQSFPLRRQSVIEAALDPFDRDELSGDTAIVLDPQELGQAEEVQPAGEPRDLPVMAKRGVDETCGSDKRT